MDNGITRIKIIGSRDSRMINAESMQPAANQLYQQIFLSMGIVLKGGIEEIKVLRDEFLAGYDHKLGIDVILTFWTGQEITLQEKFLQEKYNTVTVEYYNDGKKQQKPGDWFNLKATYYFVGYWTRQDWGFNRWILLDWPAVQRATAQGLIPWEDNCNKDGHAQASFRHVGIKHIPDNCIIAKGNGKNFNWYAPGTK